MWFVRGARGGGWEGSVEDGTLLGFGGILGGDSVWRRSIAGRASRLAYFNLFESKRRCCCRHAYKVVIGNP